MRYAKSKDEAEDILQMGMIRTFKSIDSYSGIGSFEGWMKRIMVNIAVDNFRKNNKHYHHHDIDEINGHSAIVIELPDSLEVKEILSTIQKLPDGYRMVFNLFAIEGYSHKEISKKLGISESTSKTQLMKARKSLQKKLQALNTLPSQKALADG
jgi:RNA polymerase sigma-70 factor (ECF subfamily)